MILFKQSSHHYGAVEMNIHIHDVTAFSCTCITVPENHRATFDFGHLCTNIVDKNSSFKWNFTLFR